MEKLPPLQGPSRPPQSHSNLLEIAYAISRIKSADRRAVEEVVEKNPSPTMPPLDSPLRG